MVGDVLRIHARGQIGLVQYDDVRLVFNFFIKLLIFRLQVAAGVDDRGSDLLPLEEQWIAERVIGPGEHAVDVGC